MLSLSNRILDGLRAVNAGIERPSSVGFGIGVVLFAELPRALVPLSPKYLRSLRRLVDPDHGLVPSVFLQTSQETLSSKLHRLGLLE